MDAQISSYLVLGKTGPGGGQMGGGRTQNGSTWNVGAAAQRLRPAGGTVTILLEPLPRQGLVDLMRRIFSEGHFTRWVQFTIAVLLPPRMEAKVRQICDFWHEARSQVAVAAHHVCPGDMPLAVLVLHLPSRRRRCLREDFSRDHHGTPRMALVPRFIGSNRVHDWIDTSQDETINAVSLAYADNSESVAAVMERPRYISRRNDIGDNGALSQIQANYPKAAINRITKSHIERSIHDPDASVQTDVVENAACGVSH